MYHLPGVPGVSWPDLDAVRRYCGANFELNIEFNVKFTERSTAVSTAAMSISLPLSRQAHRTLMLGSWCFLFLATLCFLALFAVVACAFARLLPDASSRCSTRTIHPTIVMMLVLMLVAGE